MFFSQSGKICILFVRCFHLCKDLHWSGRPRWQFSVKMPKMGWTFCHQRPQYNANKCLFISFVGYVLCESHVECVLFVTFFSITEKSAVDPIELCATLTTALKGNGLQARDHLGRSLLHWAAYRGAGTCCMHLIQVTIPNHVKTCM